MADGNGSSLELGGESSLRVNTMDFSDEDSDEFFMGTSEDVEERLQQAMASRAPQAPNAEPAPAQEPHAEAEAELEPEAEGPSQEQVRGQDVVVIEGDTEGSGSEGSSDSGAQDTYRGDKEYEVRTRSGMKRARTVEDENDLFFQSIAKRSQSLPVQDGSGAVRQDKVYYVQFISHVDGTKGKSVQVKALGSHPFSKLVAAALSGLMRAHRLPSVMRPLYQPESVVSYWNRAKVLGFMTCDTLRVPQRYGSDYLEIQLVPVKEEAQYLEQEVFEEPERAPTPEEDAEEEFERELRDAKEVRAPVVDLESEEVLRVALQGQDNKKVYVNVKPTTTFARMIEYYRTQKQLPRSTQITLALDDEPLDPHATVKSQDIEDEDMLEVRLS